MAFMFGALGLVGFALAINALMQVEELKKRVAVLEASQPSRSP